MWHVFLVMTRCICHNIERQMLRESCHVIPTHPPRHRMSRVRYTCAVWRCSRTNQSNTPETEDRPGVYKTWIGTRNGSLQDSVDFPALAEPPRRYLQMSLSNSLILYQCDHPVSAGCRLRCKCWDYGKGKQMIGSIGREVLMCDEEQSVSLLLTLTHIYSLFFLSSLSLFKFSLYFLSPILFLCLPVWM